MGRTGMVSEPSHKPAQMNPKDAGMLGGCQEKILEGTVVQVP